MLAAIRTDLARSPFQGEGHRKVYARLRILDDIRVSRTRVLRVMRAQGLLSPHRGRQGEMKAHDGTIVTSAPDVRCFRHQLLLPRPYLVLTKPLRLDIQCQRGASVKIGWKYLDD